MVGYLEESEGVKSSTRLFGAILVALSTLVVFTMCAYVLFFTPDWRVVTALAGSLTPLVVQGAVAIAKRNEGVA